MLTKAEIKLYRSLDDRRCRSEAGMFVVEGHKMVAEAMSSPLRVLRVLTTSPAPVFGNAELISRKDMERVSMLKTPTEYMAIVQLPDEQENETIPEGLFLVLDSVRDPGNMGTILRTADWFGITEMICSPDCADRFNPKVVQASMGSVFRVRVSYADLSPVLERLNKQSVPLFGTFMDGEDIYDTTLPVSGSAGIVFGNEGNGISDTVAAFINRRLSIPSFAAGPAMGPESLNVAVSAGIVCSEFRRRAK